MATIRAARQTYKNTRSTTDAWFMRIKRTDGKEIRLTNAYSNVTVSNRVLADASTEAIGTDLIYYSAAGAVPTAASLEEGLKAGSLDINGILGQATGTQSYSRTIQHTPLAVNVTASSINLIGDAISCVVDGDKGALADSYLFSSDPADNTEDNLEWLKFDFRTPVKVNRVRFYDFHTGNVTIGIRKSDDGSRFDEVLPLSTRAMSGSPDFEDLALPYSVQSRFIQLVCGAPSGGGYDIAEVEFFYDETISTSGTVNRADLLNGLYENAEVYIFATDYTDPYEDDEKIFRGIIKGTELRDNTFTFQVASFVDVLGQITGGRFEPSCPAKFGSFACGIHLDPPDWSSDFTAHAKETNDAASGTWVKPTTPDGYYYFATTSGAVGGSEPTWPATVGGTVVDGSVTWQCVRAFRVTTTITTVTDSRNLVINALSVDSDDTWTAGSVKFLDGDLEGVEMFIKDQTGTTVTFEQALANLPTAGDSIQITMGCRKRFDADCGTKYDNKVNFRGFPFIPGIKVASQRGSR